MFIELFCMACLTGLVLFCQNYFQEKRKSFPKVQYRKNKLNNAIVSKCQRLSNPFLPTLWAKNSHVQTWLSMFLPKPPIALTRELLELKDGGVISLDWFDLESPKNKELAENVNQTSSILIIIPSRFSTSSCSYNTLIESAVKQGYHPVIFNGRGLSQTSLFTKKLAPFCDITDLNEAITYINKVCPFSDIVAVSYSFRAAPLIAYLGVLGSRSLLTAAMCISASPDGGCVLNSGLAQPYDWIVTDRVVKEITSYPCLEGSLNFQELKCCTSFKEVQKLTYAVTDSQEDFDDYLLDNNSYLYTAAISVPTLFLTAQDDPVVNKELNKNSFRSSSSCILVSTEQGGHCGFYENDGYPNSWAEGLALDFFDAVFESRDLMLKKVAFRNGLTRLRSMTT